MTNSLTFGKTTSWFFGILFFTIGFINMSYGNDTGFGIFIILLSLFYFLPLKEYLKEITGLDVRGLYIGKIAVGLFILWAALGVGELFDKIDLMLHN